MKQKSETDGRHRGMASSFHQRSVSIVTGGRGGSHSADSSSHMNRVQPREDGAQSDMLSPEFAWDLKGLTAGITKDKKPSGQ